MHVQSVKIKNFMPFEGEYELHFEPNRIVSIRGEYDGDPARSNRAGKSAFVDALIWALYGRSRAKREVELIHNTQEEARVTVEIVDGDKTFKVTRWRSSDNKGGVDLSGSYGERKKVAQNKIDELIGMDWAGFEATAFFRQNDIDQFMEADPQNKKQILMRWLSQAAWERYESDAKNLHAKLRDRRLELAAKLESLPAEDLDVEGLKGQLKQSMKTRDNYEGELKKLSDWKVKLELEIRELRETANKQQVLVDIDKKIFRLRAQRPDSAQAKERVKQIKEALAKYPDVDREKFEKAMTVRDKCVSKLAEIGAEERQIQAQLDTLNRSMTGVCPILEQACDRVERDPKMVKGLQKKLGTLENHRAIAEEKRDKCDKVMKLFRKREEWQNQLDRAKDIAEKAAGLEEQIAELEAEKRRIFKSIPDDVDDALQKLLGELDRIPEAETKLRRGIQSLHETEAQLKAALETHRTAREKRRAWQQQLAEVDLEIGDCLYVAYMYGKNGIPSQQLENSFQEVEDDANHILGRLRAPFHLEFQATRELNDWEPACLACGTVFERGTRSHQCKECGTERQKKRRDELQLKIFEGESERPFYLDSGGGKILLSVAIRLALIQLAKRRSGSRWNTVFLDELFGQLDQTNRRNMAELVASTLSKELGFAQIFLISHDAGIESAISDKLVVHRHAEAGWSELRMH